MKNFKVSILFFIVSLILFATHSFVGSYVDANGILIEPRILLYPIRLFVSYPLSFYSNLSNNQNKFYKRYIEVNGHLVVFFITAILCTLKASNTQLYYFFCCHDGTPR